MSSRIYGLVVAACLAAAPLAASAQEAIAPEEAVARALRHNPSLAAAVLESESARWAVEGEDARFSPRLRLDASARHDEVASLGPAGTGRTGVDTLGAGASVVQRLRIGTDLALRVGNDTRWNRSGGIDPLVFGPVYQNVARLELTQPLLRGAGATVAEAGLRQARARETVLASAATRNASELVRDVIGAWWELWYAEEVVAIQRESLRLAEQQRDEARRRVELGTQAPVSVYAFETRVAQRLEELATAERVRRERAVVLAALVGGSEEPLSVARLAPPVPVVPPAALARERALAVAPAVQEAQAAAELARVQAETAADPARPRLDVQGYAEAGQLAPTFAGLGGGESQSAWSAGVNVIFELPLDGREIRSARAQAQLAVDGARQRLAQARLSTEASVEQELARVENASARVELSQQTLAFAERQLAGERARFATGGATSLQVLEAEEEVRNARLRIARAQVDLQGAAAAVEHLTGELVARWVPPGSLAARAQ